MQEQLKDQDFTKFHALKPRLLEAVDRMLAVDIAQLMAIVPNEDNDVNEFGKPVINYVVNVVSLRISRGCNEFTHELRV
ncbi:PREDICTED: EH domain-containing protein 2-like [Priapulus caudatus]|uniref:EH domain-containing protein 2-like n=1 Tax=Priapulus caudatus TaxID=37621 RepID=A0ABM1E8N6_PRICU|nr:PREDICTED: EH domain-containing protein 2-like [Priapulus caudatus]